MSTLWIRSAFWVGRAKPGMDEAFRAYMDQTLIPGLRALPGVRDAKSLWPRVREDNPPDLMCQILVEFSCRADVDHMLASPERREMRPRVLAALAMFDGQFSHIEYEVGGS